MTPRVLLLTCLLSLPLASACSETDSGETSDTQEPSIPSETEVDDSQDQSGDASDPGDEEAATEPGGQGDDVSSEPPCSLLEPIAVARPSPELFDGTEHPRAPIRAAELTGPLPTNHFMGSLLVQPGHEAVYVHPYVLKLNTQEPYGLSISHSDDVLTGGSGADGAVQFYFNVFERDMGLSMVESIDDRQITYFDDVSVTLAARSAEGAQVSWPMVRGMAYVTGNYENATPVVFTQHAITRINGQVAQQGGTYSGHAVGIQLNNGDHWRLYSGGDGLTWMLSGSRLVAQSTTDVTVRLAKVPGGDGQAAVLLDNHAATYPTGMRMSAAMHATEPDAASYSFQWQTAGGEPAELLHYALPHHSDIITSAASPVDLQLRSTTKGMMQAFVGHRWTLREPALSQITWLPPRDPTESMQNDILQSLHGEIEEDFEVPGGSYYFAGKSLYKRALLCLLAEDADLADLTTVCVSKLREAMAPFVENRWDHPIRYDETWGGMVSSAGLSGDAMADFGNSYYNDHHYHWGYFLQTAAILRKLDPAWGVSHSTWVQALIRDVTNPSQDDTYFPVFRSFDWFSGHSWSQGLFVSADGKDQESTSEEVHFHYGLMLWGLASDDARLYNLGRLMFAAATRSINTYFLMRAGNSVHPAEFTANKVTGIFFENKCDYTTWFGSNREYIHGIQMLPVTPITEAVRYSDFVAEEWEILAPLAPTLTSGWKSILYTSYATIDPDGAFEVLRDAPLDDGLTRTWALYWAATRPEPGEVIRPALPETEAGYRDWESVSCP